MTQTLTFAPSAKVRERMATSSGCGAVHVSAKRRRKKYVAQNHGERLRFLLILPLFTCDFVINEAVLAWIHGRWRLRRETLSRHIYALRTTSGWSEHVSSSQPFSFPFQSYSSSSTP